MNPQDPYQNGPAYPQNPNQPLPAPNQPTYPTMPPVVQVPVPGHQPIIITPNQPVSPQQQPSVDQSPYDFIINPQKPTKTRVPIGGNSMVSRVFIALGGLAILVVVGAIVASLIGGGSGNLKPLQTVAQEQNELIRVAAIGAASAQSETTQALAYNIQVTTVSSYIKVNNYLVANHNKINTKLLGSKHLAATDTELRNALSNGTYDATLTTILQQDLTSYQQALKAAYTANPGPDGRLILKSGYNGTELLLAQSKQNQTTLSSTTP